jgi:AraC-like DNA-binding protein
MSSSFDITNINLFLQSFYKAVGIRISVFDNQFSLVTEYPVNAPKFCSLIRTDKRGLNGCKECDVAALKIAKKKGCAHVYTCHAGLTEAAAPIKYDGIVMGYVILAHMLPQENYDANFNNALKKAVDYGLDESKVRAALKDINAQSTEKINACVQLLNAVAAYLHIANWVKWNNQDFATRISQYIDQNIDKELSSDFLCRTFFISRTKLYQISISAFGKSITKFVLFKKIERAKELLKDGFTVSQTAKRVGFSNPNYFGKVFKKQVGISAGEFKKNN